MAVPVIIPIIALASAFTWGTAAEVSKSNLHVPQTPQEKAQHVERIRLPCIADCGDPKHYAYILREVD